MSSQGKFVWYQLMTPDPAAAATFYHDVVGLTAFDPNMPGAPYTILNAGGTSIGGIMATPENHPAPPHWIGYIYVDDVDAASARITAAGGQITRPASDIPTVGRFAVVADPQGAHFIIFKPSAEPENPPAPAPQGTPGHVGWHELHAVDGSTAFPFYEKLFGWSLTEAHDMGPMGTYQTFVTNGGGGGLMTKQSPGGPFWLYYFNVADIDAATARVTKAGGHVDMGPTQVPGGIYVIVARDPQNAHFALVGPRVG